MQFFDSSQIPADASQFGHAGSLSLSECSDCFRKSGRHQKHKKYWFCKLEVVWIHSITEDNNQSDDHLSIDRMIVWKETHLLTPELFPQRQLQTQSDRSSSENLLKNKPVVWWIYIVSRLILGNLSSKINTWNVIFARLIWATSGWSRF